MTSCYKILAHFILFAVAAAFLIFHIRSAVNPERYPTQIHSNHDAEETCSKIVKLRDFESYDSSEHQAFFLETSGKPFLAGRQACSVESAALKSNLTLHVIFKSETLDLSKSKSFCDIYFKYKNVNYYSADFEKVFSGTPVEGIKKRIDNVVAHGVCHYSDIARLALLYKYGGFYLDMDIIILKSLREVKNAYSIEHAKPRVRRWAEVGLCLKDDSSTQRSHQIFNGNLHLSAGHELPWRILEHVNKTYNSSRSDRHMIGPEVSSGVIKAMFHIKTFYNEFMPSPTKNSKSSLSILPGHAFLPADYEDVGPLLWPSEPKTPQQWDTLFNCSYMVHYYSNKWGKLKASGNPKRDSYSYLGPNFCPKAFQHLDEF